MGILSHVWCLIIAKRGKRYLDRFFISLQDLIYHPEKLVCGDRADFVIFYKDFIVKFQ